MNDKLTGDILGVDPISPWAHTAALRINRIYDALMLGTRGGFRVLDEHRVASEGSAIENEESAHDV